MATILTIDELLKRGKEAGPATTVPAAAAPVAPQFTMGQLLAAADSAAFQAQGFGVQGSDLKRASDARIGYLNSVAGAAGTLNQQTGVNAAAAVDLTKSRLMPGESAAQIALQGSQAKLLGQQASVVRADSAARNAGIYSGIAVDRANVGLIGENTRGARINNTQFTPQEGLAEEFARRRLYSLGSIVPGR